MFDPKEYLLAVAPKKGDCYICGKPLITLPSLQINVNIPLTKMKKDAGRVCMDCAAEVKSLIDARMSQGARGEFQA